MDMKRFFLYAIVIAALALAGCGGNGGGGGDMTGGGEPTTPTTPTEPTPPPGPTPEEMALKDAQDAAMTAYMMAMGYVNGARDYVAMGNAMKYANMAKGASDMAAAATTSAMAEEYQMKAEMYRDQAMEAAMMRSLGITMLANKIINQDAIDNAVLEGKTGDDVPKPNSNLKARVGTALDNSAGRAPVVETTNMRDIAQGADAAGTADEAASVTVDHKATGLEFTVTRGTGAVLRGEDPTPLMTSGEKPSGGWPGAELTRTDTPAGKTYVNVYTDINPDTQLYDSTDQSGAGGRNNTTPIATEIAALTGNSKARLTADAGIPQDGSSFTGTYNADTLDNNPPVAGQFNCATGTACSISVDADGNITAVQGYQFHPTSTVTKPDADYMAWGVWLSVPDVAADGTIGAATTGAFASGNQPFSVRAALKGTATYTGDATGLYAASGYVDYFDADVTLNANFGGTAGADSGDATNDAEGDDLLGAVTGSITNIRAGGMGIDGMLTLKKANIIDGDDNGSDMRGFTADVSGTLAGRAMVGNWGGQFFGPDDATGTAAETQYPTTAAGTFGATAPGNVNDPVRILGSFGAWKAE